MLETFITESDAGVHTHASEEVETTTPRQRDVQALDSDGDVELTEPYETPIVLQRHKRKPPPIPVSESEAEESQQRKGFFIGNKQREGNKAKARHKFVLID